MRSLSKCFFYQWGTFPFINVWPPNCKPVWHVSAAAEMRGEKQGSGEGRRGEKRGGAGKRRLVQDRKSREKGWARPADLWILLKFFGHHSHQRESGVTWEHGAEGSGPRIIICTCHAQEGPPGAWAQASSPSMGTKPVWVSIPRPFLSLCSWQHDGQACPRGQEVAPLQLVCSAQCLRAWFKRAYFRANV